MHHASCIITMHHDASWGSMTDKARWPVMMNNYNALWRCIMMILHDESWSLMIHHDHSLMMNRHDSSWWIIVIHHNESSWCIMVIGDNESWWFTLMSHRVVLKGFLSGLSWPFPYGHHHIIPRRPFCHVRFLPWCPRHFSKPRHSKWDDVAAGVGTKTC